MKDPNYDDFCRDLTIRMLDEDFDADGRDDILCQGKKYQQFASCFTITVPCASDRICLNFMHFSGTIG